MKKEIFDFAGKTVIITGATKGIGREFANAFASHGANVVITSRSQADCDKVSNEIANTYKVKALGIGMDVTKKDIIVAMLEKVVSEFGVVDILVNNAGSAITKKAEDLTEEDWDRVIDIDLKGVFLCSSVVGKHMIEQKKGIIINTASMLGLAAEKMVLPYCVAKSGVLQMTRALALEWSKYNIRVNAICPGYIKTPMNAVELEAEKISRHILSRTPMGRYGTTDEMCGAVLFLASEASSYMTGQYILLDGGRTAGC